jgi:uncharacterized RmlC-like cupin family protein
VTLLLLHVHHEHENLIYTLQGVMSEYFDSHSIKIKATFSLERAMKAQRGS